MSSCSKAIFKPKDNSDSLGTFFNANDSTNLYANKAHKIY